MVTEQSVLVEFGLTLSVPAEAFRQHQQATLAGYACHNRQPKLIVNLDHQPRTHFAAVRMVADKRISQLLQLFQRNRGTQVLHLYKSFQGIA
jgi:hypothetical protein